MIPRRFAFPILLMVALATLTGCPFITSNGKDPVVPPADDYLPQTTISNVLDNLKKAYIAMNYDEYVKLFDASYTYVFAPQDVGGPQNNPESWGLADELVSARHLFSKTDANIDGYVAQSLTLQFERGDEIPNDLNGWTKVVLSAIFLRLETRNATVQDPLYYEVNGDGAYLWFKKVGTNWYIVQWEDRPISHKMIAEK